MKQMSQASRNTAAMAGLTAVALFGAVACSSESTDTETTTTTSEMTTTTTTSAMETTTAAMPDPAAGLVGIGCAGYAEQVPTGPGSVMGMSTEPVTVAASNNPLLTTLTSALSGGLNPDVNLVDTLNNGEYTVFAPTDDAFAKLDPATIEALETDSEMLTSILTYHVVSGQVSPADVVGEQVTLQGELVNVTGEGQDLMFNDAGLVCGGVQTANATVYLIDTVLTPPAS